MSGKKAGLIAAALVAGLLVPTPRGEAQAPAPTLALPAPAAEAPKIDGLLDDGVWKTAAVFTDFRRSDGKAPSGKARLLLAQDAACLYLAVESFEDEKTLKSLVAEVTRHDAEGMWDDDEVELFIGPGGAAKGYYQIAVNSRGVTWDGYHAVPGNSDASWDPGYRCMAATGASSWVVELAIPWKAFDSTLKFADAWAFNVLITRQAAHEELWLAPIRGNAHQPEKFALLTGAVGAAPAGAKERAPIIREKPDPTKEPYFHLYEARTYTDKDGRTLLYRLVRPEPLGPDAPRPLVIYLHGAGLRGENNIDQIPEFHDTGLAAVQRYGAVFVAPQCPASTFWTFEPPAARPRRPDAPEAPAAESPTAQAQSRAPLKLLTELVPELVKEFHIDKDRIYLCGGSMGGGGVYKMLDAHPELFAAGIICCGAGADASKAPKFAGVPLWFFHGDKDKTVPTQSTRDMVAALKKAGGNPRYTEVKGAGHNLGSSVTDEKDLLPWLFAQKRSARP